MIKLVKSEGGVHYRREGKKLVSYKPGDAMEVCSTKSMKSVMDRFERMKEAEGEALFKGQFKRKK